jgi:hypothetical protein
MNEDGATTDGKSGTKVESSFPSRAATTDVAPSAVGTDVGPSFTVFAISPRRLGHGVSWLI